MIVAGSSRALPEVPIQTCRDRGFFSLVFLLIPDNAINVPEGITSRMDFGNLSDGSGLDHFDKEADAVRRVALIAHLSDNFMLDGGGTHGPHFSYRVGERFFAVDVFAMTDCR